MREHTNFVIIGASAAGISAAFTLRHNNASINITVLSKENVLPYNKCLLIDYLQEQRPNIFLRSKEDFEKARIDLRLSSKVVKISAPDSKIILNDDSQIIYDKLLIASGADIKTPELLKNLPDDCPIFPYHTLQDTKRIQDFLKQFVVKNICIIGAGINGLEIASSLRSKNYKVTLFESHTRTLKNFPENLAQQIQDICKAKGLSIYKSINIFGFNTGKNQLSLETNQGKFDFDLVIYTPGIISNTSFAPDLEKGHEFIKVNSKFETNKKNIYAAGDCAIIVDSEGNKFPQRFLWAQAIEQGINAAYNMLGNEKIYDPKPAKFFCKFFEYQIVSDFNSTKLIKTL